MSAVNIILKMAIQGAIRTIIPPLLSSWHKGQLGKILVIGGSEDYTGAPFFASMSSMLTGADMAHVICTKSSCLAIKSYSPDIMVHPYLNEEPQFSDIDPRILPLLEKIDAVLIGPGLGRDSAIFNQIIKIIKLVDEHKLPLVIDADGLFLVQQQPNVVKDIKNSQVFLTPNVMEYYRLQKAMGIDLPFEESVKRSPVELAQYLGANILLKNKHDIIASKSVEVSVEEQSGLRRVSGQGDILSGAVTTFVSWSKAYSNNMWETKPLPDEFKDEIGLVAMYGASALVRRASRIAYEKHGRSLVTTNILNSVGPAFKELYE